MKTNRLKTLCAGVALALLSACQTWTPTEGAIALDAYKVAQIGLTAVANGAGGPEAGELASAGFSALGSVVQGYIGSKVPSEVVQATPGIDGLGEAAAEFISSDKTVTQKDVDVLNAAAAILQPPAAQPATSGIDPDNQVLVSGTPAEPYRVCVYLRDRPDPSAAVDVSPLGTWWTDEGGVEYERL